MDVWQPNDDQLTQWNDEGYFILRGVVSCDVAYDMRGVIKNEILQPEPSGSPDEDPMDPMGNSPEAKARRFRKLGNFCSRSPLIWHSFHTGTSMLSVARYFLGEDIIVKFNSVFVKPAETGSETPWHQDNGLWRDGETEPFNAWMALDPAMKSNGCLQFIPGSHKTEIVPHVLYDDSIHPELPRDLVPEQIAQKGIVHVECDPGDVVCWHSSLWHHSPPNTSSNSRIAIAGVWTNPIINKNRKREMNKWALKNGTVCNVFPPESAIFPDDVPFEPAAHKKA